MSETLNFGPEWLRALSTGSSGGVPQFKLAEHRYGREEMLALFCKTDKFPQELAEFHSILRKECQSPLTLTPLSEEERWSLSQSVNSAMAIRATGRGAGVAPPAARGRGVSRGRGRGREYKRSVTYEEEGGFARREYNRTMSWDDSNDSRYEKGSRLERSYEEEGGSPRKVIERERGSTSDNWRSPRERGERIPSRYEEDEWRRSGAPRQRLPSREGEDNWRTSGSSQAPPRTSWHSRDRERTNSSSEYDHDRGDGFREPDRDKTLRERPYSGSRGRHSSQPEEEEMPAWSNLDEDFDDDEIGVFDASGAFSAVKKSDLQKGEAEKGGKEEKEKGVGKEGDDTSKRDKDNLEDRPAEQTPDVKDKSDKEPRKPSDREKLSPKDNNNLSNVQLNSNLSKPPDGHPRTKSPISETLPHAQVPAKSEPSNSVSNIVRDSTLSSKSERKSPTETKVSPESLRTNEIIVSSATGMSALTTNQTSKTVTSPTTPLPSTPEVVGPSQLIPGVNVGGSAIATHAQGGAPSVDTSKDDEEDQLQHLEKAAEDLMAELDEDEKLNEEMNTQTESQLIPTPKLPAPEEPPMVVPPTHKDAHRWFYKDPQNQVQGPFNSSEMLEWFRAGYFTLGLQVKQGMDEGFQPLGALIKIWGKVPFMTSPPASSPVPPQMITPTPPTPAAAPTPAVPPQPVAPQMGPMPSPGPSPTVLPEHWSKIAQMTVLAQKKQQQIMQQQQQQQAFHTLLQQQQSLIRVSASRIYQDLIQRGKTLTLSQQQALRQQLVGLQQQHQLLLQQQQNWARVQQALNIIPQPPSLAGPGMAAGRMSKPPMMMDKSHGPGEEMQISVWDPVPTEKSRNEWSIGVWDPEMAKDITEEDRIKAAQQEAIRRKLEEEQEKILRGQELKFRQEERRRIEESQAKRIEEELKRAQEEQLIMEEIRKNNELKLKELEAEHKELQAKVLGQPMVPERKSPVEVAKSPSPEESQQQQQQDDLKKLEELHQKQKEAEEQLKKETEQRKSEEAMVVKQQEAARKEQERASREQEEMKREMEKQEQQQQLLRQQQESQRQQQQQEALRRMQQQQQQQPPTPQASQPPVPQTTAPPSIPANNFSLPSSAMWGQPRPPPTTSSAPTLAQIQQMQQQQEERERQNRQRQMQMLEQQHQQQQQQQQAKQARSVGWATSQSTAPASGQSLREIQQEQARQQLERQRQSKAAPNIPMPAAPPVVSGSAWGSGGSGASNGSQMAWGGGSAPAWNRGDLGQQRSSPVTTSSASMGFWDDAQEAISRTSTPNATTNYPPLRSNSSGGMNNQRQSNIKSRMAKEEENVHRLFQGNVGSDEFSQWCEVALQRMGASVDIPTFISFLQEVESPYEVHEYVKTYLGDSGESTDFARKFLEQRTRFKEHQRKHNEQMKAWINQVKSTASGMTSMAQLINTSPTTTTDPLGKRKEDKKGGRKRQLVDPSILGFSVSAAERVNIGEIQTIDDA